MLDDPKNFRTADEPDGMSEFSGWRIRRHKGTQDLRVVSLVSKQFLVYCHWNGAQTVPCRKTGATEAQRRAIPRQMGYILGYDVKDGARCIFEYPRAAAETIYRIQLDNGTLLGRCLRFNRSGKGDRGKVWVQDDGVISDLTKLDRETPIWPVLACMWHLEADEEVVQESIRQIPIIPPLTPDVVGGMNVNCDDADWLHAKRARDLAGQRILFDAPAKNGKKVD